MERQTRLPVLAEELAWHDFLVRADDLSPLLGSLDLQWRQRNVTNSFDQVRPKCSRWTKSCANALCVGMKQTKKRAHTSTHSDYGQPRRRVEFRHGHRE